MNEEQLAEKFNLELDRCLSGDRIGDPGHDTDAMETAVRFVRADFSSDSAIQGTLREKLVSKSRDAGDFSLIGRLLGGDNRWKAAAFAAACVLLVIAPILRRDARQSPADPMHTGTSIIRKSMIIAVQKPRSSFSPVVKREETAAAEMTAADLFHSRPMGRLEGERLRDFPIETGKVEFPVVSVAGREFRSRTRAGVIWETEDGAIMLESRQASMEELFQRGT